MNNPTSSPAPTNQDEKQNQIADYLQAPRRKRKNFVVLALGRSFPIPVRRTIENVIKKDFTQLAIVSPDNMDELRRLFGRNISLLIVNDELDKLENLLIDLRKLKEKRKADKIPILFMTKHPYDLIQAYNAQMLIYQELDDYLCYDNESGATIASRIKDIIDTENKRKSRRYVIKHPVTFFHLTKDKKFTGEIIDLSFHGAAILADNCILREGDQLLVSIPLSEQKNFGEGDFLKISARVRRVFISGNRVGVSFEHVSTNQSQKLAQFILTVASASMRSQTARLKAYYDEQSKADL